MTDSVEIIVNERERIYHWVTGVERRFVKYENVAAVRVSASGNHYLRLRSGYLVIVKPYWDYIEILPETNETGWTF